VGRNICNPLITHMYCDARYDIPKSNTEALHRNRKAWQRAIARELTKRDKKIKVTRDASAALSMIKLVREPMVLSFRVPILSG
jgi:hypothetical protein